MAERSAMGEKTWRRVDLVYALRRSYGTDSRSADRFVVRHGKSSYHELVPDLGSVLERTMSGYVNIQNGSMKEKRAADVL
jgi:hypothetical protein